MIHLETVRKHQLDHLSILCGGKIGSSKCDTCAYNVYDEEDECYYCEVSMDEDDMVRMMEGHYRIVRSCSKIDKVRDCEFGGTDPDYRNGDGYAVVKRQI